MIALIVDKGGIHVNWLFVTRALFSHYYYNIYIYIYMRSGRMSLLMTGFVLPGLTESSESKSCKDLWESYESH